MARSTQTSGQAGFSLIELMIAMVATMIISGAIFGLLTAGNTAFRREPELADRQQNIRVAMNLITEDLRRAGTSMPRFQQVFEMGLDGAGPMGPHNEETDHIQMLTSGDCDVRHVCSSDGVNVVTNASLSGCYSLPAVVFLVDSVCPTQDEECSGFYWAEPPGSTSVASCGGTGGNNGHVVLPPGKAEIVPNPPGGPPFDPNYMGVGAVARYRINFDATGVPNLERSATGGIDVGGKTWEIIARGIEDLQVQYLNGSGVWTDEPGDVSCTGCPNPTPADYDTIVQRVRVRLSARALAPNLQGQRSSETGGDAVRGELVSEITPQAAAITIAQSNQQL